MCFEMFKKYPLFSYQAHTYQTVGFCCPFHSTKQPDFLQKGRAVIYTNLLNKLVFARCGIINFSDNFRDHYFCCFI
jgi:hypothetical protein